MQKDFLQTKEMVVAMEMEQFTKVPNIFESSVEVNESSILKKVYLSSDEVLFYKMLSEDTRSVSSHSFDSVFQNPGVESSAQMHLS